MARIAVVGPDADIRAVLAEILRDEGHTVVDTSDARRLVQATGVEAVDALVVDTDIGASAGDEQLIDWLSTAAHLHLPLLVLVIDPPRHCCAGEDFLRKPFELDALIAAVGRLVARTMT
jgi:two-component system nitrogen regulation response regulator NtrX